MFRGGAMTFEEYAAWRLPALVRYAAVLTGDRDLAQDIVQEVLARAHARWRKISGLEVPDLYVRRMITNEFVSWRRRWTRLVPVGQVAEDRQPAGVADVADAAAVLVLRIYEGLSDTEIAEVLGCRPGTVRGYASRALAALRVELGPAGSHRSEPAVVGEDA